MNLLTITYQGVSESYGVTLRTRKLTMKQIDKTAKELKKLMRKAKA